MAILRKAMLIATIALAGCGLQPTKIKNIQVDRVTKNLDAISYDASRRGVFVIRKGSKEYLCPEPNPDWGTQYTSTYAAQFDLTAGGGATAGLGLPGANSLLPSLADLKNIQASVLDGKGKPLDLSKLSPLELGKLQLNVQASAGVRKMDSQVPHQLAIESAISMLRSGLFWQCITAVNADRYDYQTVAEGQKELVRLAHELIQTYRLDTVNKGSQELIDRAKAANLDKNTTSKLVESYVSRASQTPYDLASQLERDGFSAILDDDVATAARLFRDAEAAYPKFHSVYEISRLLRSSSGSITGKQLQDILDKYSWRTDRDQLSLLVAKCRKMQCRVPDRLKDIDARP